MSRTQTGNLTIRLALTEDQTARLQSLRDSETSAAAVPGVTVRPRFGEERAIIVKGSGFTTSSTHIEVDGIGKLLSHSPISRTHVGFKKKYLCLIEKDGWTAHIALAKKSRSSKRYLKPQIVSGGLPSLGKGSK